MRNTKRFLVGVVAIPLFPALAHAQEQASGEHSSGWAALVWSLIPIILIVPLFLLIIRRTQKPILRRSQRHMERQMQHMERVEQSLERLVKAVEKNAVAPSPPPLKPAPTSPAAASISPSK